MRLLDDHTIHGATDWLLANGSPPVRYLTHRHLLHTSPRTKTFKQVLAEAQNCPEAQEIFSQQCPDGSWYAGGSWSYPPTYMPKDGYSPFTPKYVTTVWVLPLLGDLGLTAGDARIKRACEYVLAFQRPNGSFSRFKADQKTQRERADDPTANHPCDLAIYLLALGAVGLGRSQRLRKSYDLLLRFQREDGGWVSQFHKDKFHWTRSCPWVTYHAAAALYNSGVASHRTPLRKALEFLVWHLALKDEDQIRQPFYHGHLLVTELLMFSEARVGLSKRPVRVMLDYLLGLFDPQEGCFRYRPPGGRRRRGDPSARVLKYRLHHLMEDDWLTYYAVRILRSLR